MPDKCKDGCILMLAGANLYKCTRCEKHYAIRGSATGNIVEVNLPIDGDPGPLVDKDGRCSTCGLPIVQGSIGGKCVRSICQTAEIERLKSKGKS